MLPPTLTHWQAACRKLHSLRAGATGGGVSVGANRVKSLIKPHGITAVYLMTWQFGGVHKPSILSLDRVESALAIMQKLVVMRYFWITDYASM